MKNIKNSKDLTGLFWELNIKVFLFSAEQKKIFNLGATVVIVLIYLSFSNRAQLCYYF